jgi:AhpD family alkylhydroperoxidase
MRRIDYPTVAPDAFEALMSVERYARQSGLERSLLHLVKLRASYMNGCAYCVDMHTKEARHDGESEQRLFAVPGWKETPFFTPRERAALQWTETVTQIAGGVPDEVYDAVRCEFDELSLVNLTMAIVAINSWNRMSVSLRTEVGTYEVPANRKGATGFRCQSSPATPRGPENSPGGEEPCW